MTEKEFWKAFRDDFGVDSCDDFSIPVIEMFSPLYQLACRHNVFCEDVSDLPEDIIQPGRLAFLTDEDHPSRCLLVKFRGFMTKFKLVDAADFDHFIAVCPLDIFDDFYDFIYTSDYERLYEKFKKESD